MLIGLTAHDPDITPPVPYNCVRTWDRTGKYAWLAVDLLSGYDWSDMDTLAADCIANGRQFIWVPCLTPSRFRTDELSDPYGNLGGASMPTPEGVIAFRAFLRAGMDRYPPSVMPIVEGWNEPTAGGAFWHGTYAEVASLYRIVREECAVRGHIAAAPSFFELTHFTAYLASSPDSRPIGAINLHLYGNNLALLQAEHVRWRAAATANGVAPDVPFLHSEIGWIPNQQPPPDWPFGSLSGTQIGAEVEATVRWLATTSCLGYIWYDFDGYANDLTGDIYTMGGHPGVMDAYFRMEDLIFPPVEVAVPAPAPRPRAALTITPPRQGVPIGTVVVDGEELTVSPHPEYLRVLYDIVKRVGGVSGMGAAEVAAMAEQALTLAASVPPPADVIEGDGVSVTRTAAGFTVAVDPLFIEHLIGAFAAPATQTPANDAQAIFAARVFA